MEGDGTARVKISNETNLSETAKEEKEEAEEEEEDKLANFC